MELIDILLIVVHIVVAILLVIAVLLQSGKGGGLGAGFGGASAAATQIFGGRGAGNFLSRSTVVFAAVFMSTSLGLAVRSAKPRTSLDLDSTSGEVSSQEDTILEEGTLPPIDEDAVVPPATETETETEETEPAAVEPTGTNNNGGTNNGSLNLKLEDAFKTIRDSEGSGVVAPANGGVDEVKAPKPKAKPSPKPSGKSSDDTSTKKAEKPPQKLIATPKKKVEDGAEKEGSAEKDKKVQDPKEPSVKEMPKEDSAP